MERRGSEKGPSARFEGVDRSVSDQQNSKAISRNTIFYEDISSTFRNGSIILKYLLKNRTIWKNFRSFERIFNLEE
jgi:hypothetical protein